MNFVSYVNQRIDCSIRANTFSESHQLISHKSVDPSANLATIYYRSVPRVVAEVCRTVDT